MHIRKKAQMVQLVLQLEQVGTVILIIFNLGLSHLSKG
jgi:hypothetical protein